MLYFNRFSNPDMDTFCIAAMQNPCASLPEAKVYLVHLSGM